MLSTLIRKPCHISCIDEFGRYLEATKDSGKGNHHQREANTKLMEGFGRGHGVMRPLNYSTMTLKKEDAVEIENRRINNPSITILGTTTPSTFFAAINIDAVKNGFLNRFIISISNKERSIRKHMPDMDVPQNIIDWIKAVTQRAESAGYNPLSSEPANPVVLDFTQEALDMQEAFQQECFDKAKELEASGLSEIVLRSNEKAMKISLIHALSRNPNASTIEAQDMKWAINYIRECDNSAIEALHGTLSRSTFEANKKEILSDLRKRGAKGITKKQMEVTEPYSHLKPKARDEVLQSLKVAELIADKPYTTPKGGRPTTLWYALQQ